MLTANSLFALNRSFPACFMVSLEPQLYLTGPTLNAQGVNSSTTYETESQTKFKDPTSSVDAAYCHKHKQHAVNTIGTPNGSKHCHEVKSSVCLARLISQQNTSSQLFSISSLWSTNKQQAGGSIRLHN